MRRLLLGMALALTGCSASVPMTQSEQQSAPAAYPVVAGVTVAPAPRVPERFTMWRFAAPVVPVRLHGGGMLVPPADPHVLGWWGKPAGAAHGTTLLIGHSVHTGGGELDTLAATPVGSAATVSGITYRVKTVETMSKPRLAQRSATLFRQTGTPRLLVVTCARYDWTRHVWPANTVVVAVPVSTAP